MSFILLAAPLVTFTAGYLYGSYGTNTQSKVVPPLPSEIIQDIKKGIQLKHVDIVESGILWTDHDYLLRQIHNRPQLKKTEIQERIINEELWMKDLKEKLLKRRLTVEKNNNDDIQIL
jgi:hypothetical protein